MELFRTTEHLGLKTALPQPPGNSAKAMQNFVRHPHNGWLEQADGYGPKFTLPTTSSSKKISSVVISDIHNFYVKEHGGKQVTVCVGTYRKTYRFSSSYVDRVGIWISHTWNTLTNLWEEAWVELTEIEYFALSSIKDVSAIPCVDLGADYGSSFAADYFKNWIITFVDYSSAEDHYNHLLCQGNIVDVGGSETTCLQFFGNISDLTARTAGALVIVSRNWMNGNMPATLSSHIFTLFNEIRMTTGNLSTDVNAMVGFRTKVFGWATSDYSVDKLFAERACLSIWRYSFGIKDAAPVGSISSPLPKGTYKLKCTLLLDDGNETELRNPSSEELSPMIRDVDYNSSGQYSICNDLKNYYVGANNAVHKIDPLTNSLVSSTAALSVFGIVRSICHDGGFVYAHSEYLGATVVYKIDASSMAVVSFVATPAAPVATAGKIIALNGFIYVLTNGVTVTSPTLSKVNPATMVIVTTTNLTHGNTDPHSMIAYGNDIVLGYGTADPLVEELDGNTLSVVKTITLTGYTNVESLLTIDNLYVYAGVLHGLDSRIVKLNMLAQSIISETTILVGWSYPVTDMLYDGKTYIYAAYGYNNSTIIRFDPVGLTTEYTIKIDESYPMPSFTLMNEAIYAVTANGGTIACILINSYATLKMTGSQAIRFKPLISPTAPKRAKRLRIYISNDSGATYNLVKDVNLMATVGDVLAIGWDSAAYYDTYMKHFFHRGEYVTINLDDWNAIGALSSIILGRDSADNGSINYAIGTVAGNRTYVASPLIGTPAVNETNKIAVCSNGAGVIMNDIFPNDVANVIDLEYSDGDSLVALLPLGDRILALKKRNIVLVANNGGDYERDQIATGIGCCAPKTARSFEDVNYFCDYNGIYSYSTNSLKLLNSDWLLDWKALSSSVKEASIGVIDIVNRQYIVHVNGKQYSYAIDSGEWMVYDWANDPIQFAQCSPDSTYPGSIDFLTSTKIQNISKSTLHDTAQITMNWESNEINPLISKTGYSFDALMQHLVFEYESSVIITATLYLDGSSTAFATYSLAASTANVKTIVLIPLSARCKTYRVKYSAVTTGASQVVKIKSRIDYFETMPVGGDILTA